MAGARAGRKERDLILGTWGKRGEIWPVCLIYPFGGWFLTILATLS